MKRNIYVLVACEESQRVTEALRRNNITAFSCDILPTSGHHHEWHLQCDALKLLNHKIYSWDAIIAFPPCTHLASSGARWFKQKQEDGRQQEAIEFFLRFAHANCDHIAIENPVGIMSNIYRKPDQIIQPYEFGHPYSKKTCLWLKGLPKLVPTNIVEYEKIHSNGKSGGYSGASWYATDENGKILSWNDPRTATIRSKTYKGIADAMGKQWGDYLKEVINGTVK